MQFDSFAIASSAIDLVCRVLILASKRIGVFMYLGFTAASQLVLEAFGLFSISGFGFQAVVILYLIWASRKWRLV